MSHSLANVQSEFANALRYQNNGEHCDIVSDYFTDEQRIQIYRNNFVISLSEVLAATYPLTEMLVGEECFQQMARRHVLSYPSTSGDVSGYGEHFEQTIQAFPAVIEAAPYLAEVALYEWQKDSLARTYSRKSNDLCPLSDLADVPQEQQGALVFHLKDSITLVNSSYTIIALEQAIYQQQLDGLDINQPELGVLIRTENSQVESYRLTEECHQLLTELQSGQALAQINPSLLQHLNTVMALDVISGFSLNDELET
ncbi:DNA-binding domain-containing protein [Vibrio sp. Sgm 22]|uniref:HvfC/BufC N-terminal domain-containing protein n=1 Tax=unclassified Vibrio TaxID=2614977 RepID=UPI002249517B|nr:MULTISPECIES: DNA-binding domain-containing protein [unclassified Vibrio]MCX2760882.1 DNA-binding domain-containing protein [Vibrio sp. 14G-20]MCX2777841.1 DNA-binding domain-containing protein [Vibrio sp. Sgm 22]